MLTNLSANLVSTLACLKMHNFPHFVKFSNDVASTVFGLLDGSARTMAEHAYLLEDYGPPFSPLVNG